CNIAGGSCMAYSPHKYFRSLFHFLFNHPPPTEIYTLSLHDALPISQHLAARGKDAPPTKRRLGLRLVSPVDVGAREELAVAERQDRKSTRLNSSHRTISYAVFCLKKKIKKLLTINDAS